MQGIYKIKNKVNSKFYIGSSQDIEKRLAAHRQALSGGRHYNSHLQNSWNKHGENNFVFEALEETNKALEREQWYLDNVIRWGFDYNIARDAIASFLGRKHTEETKRKIREALKGHAHSEERKQKISESRTEEFRRKLCEKISPLSPEQVRGIHELYATGSYTQKEIAKLFPIGRTTVVMILTGQSWKHIYDEFHQYP